MRDRPFDSIEELDAYVAGEKIQCLECGRWFRALATHLPRTHGMTHDDYRDKWGIPRRYPLAGTSTRETLSTQMREQIDSGRITYHHLPQASDAAREVGRRRKQPVDDARHRQRVAEARPGDHSRLPPGEKRADGRDADRAREYQDAHRSQSNGNPRPMEAYREMRSVEINHPQGSTERNREYAEARVAQKNGDPWPMLKYQSKYEVQPNFSEDEDQVIREKYSEWGAARVAMLLRRTPNSIRMRAQVVNARSSSPQGGSQKFRWDHETHAPIVEQMANDGATQHEIAAALGTSATTIGKYMARLGIKPSKPRHGRSGGAEH